MPGIYTNVAGRHHAGVTAATATWYSFENTPDAVVVKTDQGDYPADLVIMSVGFRPNTQLFTGQLDMLPNGALIVNDYMQTESPCFATGDSVAVHYNRAMTIFLTA